jgi:hypothetical protein
MELTCDEAFDIQFQPLSLPALLLLYLGLYSGHLSFSFFFSRLSTDTPFSIQHISSVSCSQLAHLNPSSKHYGQ